MDLLNRQTASRLWVNLLSGLFLGGALYLLIDSAPALTGPLHIAIYAGVMTLSFAVMSLSGRLSIARALMSALGLGAVVGLAFLLAGIESLDAFLRRDISGQALVAWLLLSVVPLPALRGQALRYPVLWAATLELLVIWGAGLGFALLSWGVILPAASLLDLVGLPASDLLFANELLPFALSGMLMGGGMAVVSLWPLVRGAEILARVIRLLAPPFLLVMLVFCLALIVNGIAGDTRASVTVMSWSVLAAALLISCIAGPSGRLHRERGFWPLVAAGLTVLMLPAAAAAIWTASHRLWQQAATPSTLAEAVLAAFAAYLALGYALSLLRTGSIARVNMAAAAMLTLWSALLLPGFLSPEALAVRSHLAKLDRAELSLQDLPLRSMQLYWGQAGRDGIDRLRLRFADDPAALAHIAAMTQPSQPPISLQTTDDTTAALRVTLAGQLQILPQGGLTPEGFIDSWDTSPAALRTLLAACERKTPGGNPGCLAVAADFLPNEAGQEVLLLSLESGAGPNGKATGWQRQGLQQLWRNRQLIGDFYLFDAAEAIDRLHQEGVALRPVALQALPLNDQDIFFRPHASDQRTQP